MCKALRSGKQLRRQALAPALKGLAALKVLGLSNNNLRDDGAKARRGRTGSQDRAFKLWGDSDDLLSLEYVWGLEPGCGSLGT